MRNLHSQPQSPQAGLAVKTPVCSWLRVGVITNTRSSLQTGAPLLRLLLLCLFPFAFRLCALAQYSIDWHKIAGGGGASTGGVYSVSGTIGQPEAGGQMGGGNYSLTGGFWALYAVQTAGTPALRIQVTGTNTAMVYWPSPSTGFKPQVNTDLATTNWLAPPETVTDDGTNKYIIVHPQAGSRFYRLKNP